MTLQASPAFADESGENQREAPAQLPATPVPLSAEQRQIWLHASLAPDPALYNELSVIHSNHPLDPALLGLSLNALVQRHDILRSTFPAPDGTPVQRVGAAPRIDIPLIDLTHVPKPEREAAALRIAAAEARKPFDLYRGPVLRVALLAMTDDDYRLYVTMHHLVIDSLAMNRVVLPELSALYQAFAAGVEPVLPPLPLQYAEYAVAREGQIAGKPIAGRTKWWVRTLAGAPGTVPLPFDHARPPTLTYRGAVESFEFPPELTGRLKSFSAGEGVTLFMTLLAGLSAVYYRYSGQEDILIGGIASTRRRPGLERLVGCFINLVALRTRPAGELSFRDHLGQTRETVLAGFVAGDAPFDNIVREVQPKREASLHPLVQTVLSLETAEPTTENGWEVTYLDGMSGTAKFDIAISLHEKHGRVVGRLVYSTDLFEAATMQRLIGHWTNLLEGAAAAPDCTLARLPMLSRVETRQVLADWNATAQPCPDAMLPQLVAAQAAHAPDATAIVFGDRAWSYRELAEAGNRIAGHLQGCGVRRGSLVGIAVERSFDMVAGLLGILKTGAAYLPLDPAFPAARLALMIEDGRPAVILTQRSLAAALPQTGARILLCEDCTETVAHCEFPTSAGDDLAYVLYTSGSTGKPNGVAVPHRALVNLLAAMRREPGFGARDALLAVTTLSFDIAGLELFLPLIAGGRVVIADRETILDPPRLAGLIGKSGCTMMQATPALWRSLVEAGWQGHRGLTLLCGGEALPRELADKLLAGARLWNVYGPTETTIWSTAHPVTTGAGPVPIGRPIANTTVYILDPAGNPAPVGVAGDLLIGGVGVAQGYLNRPELTECRFVPDPFSERPGARLYRTGDVARYLADGSIEYLGRRDRQVKLRGFRIEPGDIETVLMQHAAVRQAAVIVREDIAGDPRLVAYLVPAEAVERPNVTALRQHLSDCLPLYMVPNGFAWLDALPLTPNGKIDRNALPAPDIQAEPGGFVAPSGECEEKLAAIWRDILGIERIGATDDFFDLGGHSLLVMPMRARIEAEFGRRLAISAVFHGPTVRQIAALLSSEPAALMPRTVPIQPNGARPPLYWIDPGPIFTPLAEGLGPDQPFVGLMFNTVVTSEDNQPSRIADIAPYLVESIRAAQPEGPYYLGGWCADGLLAYDIASRLVEQGQEVGLLVLIHAGNPLYIRGLSKTAVKYSTLKHQLRRLAQMGGEELRDYVRERASKALAGIAGRVMPNAATRGPGHYFDGIIDRTAMNYEPRPFAGDVALFQPVERPDVFDYRASWQGLVKGELFAFDIPGGHHTMLQQPNVQELAAKLRASLEHAQGKRQAKHEGVRRPAAA